MYGKTCNLNRHCNFSGLAKSVSVSRCSATPPTSSRHRPNLLPMWGRPPMRGMKNNVALVLGNASRLNGPSRFEVRRSDCYCSKWNSFPFHAWYLLNEHLPNPPCPYLSKTTHVYHHHGKLPSSSSSGFSSNRWWAVQGSHLSKLHRSQFPWLLRVVWPLWPPCGSAYKLVMIQST